MSEKKDNRIFTLLLGLLAIGLIGLAVFTLNFYHQQKSDLNNLENQKAAIQKKLKNLQLNYKEALEKETGLKEQIRGRQVRVQQLLDSLKVMKEDYGQLKKYQIKTEMLERQNQKFIKVVDSLSKRNKSLANQIDSTATLLSSQKDTIDLLRETTSRLQDNQPQARKITLSQITLALNQKNTQRPQFVKVCFKLKVPSSQPNGFFIQVLDPKQNVMGLRKRKKFSRKLLVYSEQFNPQVSDTLQPYCFDIKGYTSELPAGLYTINIFCGKELLSTKIIQVD